MNEFKYTAHYNKTATDEERDHAVCGWFSGYDSGKASAEARAASYNQDDAFAFKTKSAKQHANDRISWFVACWTHDEYKARNTPPEKFILWSPQGKDPPRDIMVNAKQAHVVAEKMAKEHPGQDFYVCKLVKVCSVPVPEVTWKEAK